MFGTEAGWDGVGEIEFVAGKIPVADEFFRQPTVILLNLRKRRAKSAKASRKSRRLPVRIEDQPIRMIADHVGRGIRLMVQDVPSSTVFRDDRNPPQRQVNSLFVKGVH